jgi:hypothetical protein
MILFTKSDDKKRILRNAEKSKIFSSLMTSGNALELFATSYRYVKLLFIYLRTIDTLHSLRTMHSRPFPRHQYPHCMTHCLQ